MGIKAVIGGHEYQANEYSVEESATPIAAGDTSGHVGEVRFTIPAIDRNLNPESRIAKFGPQILIGQPYELHDSRKGFVLGTISSANIDRGSGEYVLAGSSRMGALNIYNVTANPYVGTLAGAVEYYLSLAGIEHQWLVDDVIADMPVVLPGWFGELWYHLKMLVVAHECDIALVSGVIVVRPIRVRETELGREVSADIEIGGGSTAQAVEVIQHNNRPITNALVYPPGGWGDETPILTVAAGERLEQELELSASVSSIVQPVMKKFVPRYGSTTSEFCITNDEGNVVDPDEWARLGGWLKVTIGPDTKTLILTIKAPDMWNTKNGPVRTYSLGYGKSSDTHDWERYGSLRIIGTGVAFHRQEIMVRTALSENQTDDEVGETVDNPFISSRDDVFRTGTRAALRYTGQYKTYGGEVISINRRGDTGERNYPTWGEVIAAAGGTDQSWADGMTGVSAGLDTYDEITEHWYSFVRDRYTNQVFGNVTGSRVWNRDTNRWYRIRDARVTAESISIREAEDDTTWADAETYYSDINTWADYKALYDGLTWGQVDLIGLAR